MQDSGPQGLELPTPEDKDETVKKKKNTKNVYASILGHLDMSYMQTNMEYAKYVALNKS